MKNTSVGLILAVVLIGLIGSCKTDTANNSDASKIDKIITDKKSPPPASKMDPAELAKLDGQLLSFWSTFKERVDSEGVPLVRQLVLFPLEGGGKYSTRIMDDQPLTEQEFSSAYFNLIDSYARDKITQTKATQLERYTIELDGYEQSKAKLIGIPSGSTVYKLTVESGGEGMNVTVEKQSKTFHFAKLDGQYKLVWVTEG